MSEVFANADKASKIRDLKEQLGGSADELLANVDQLDVIEELAINFENDAEKMGVVFANSEKAEKLRNLSKDLEGKGGDLLANIDQLDVIEDLYNDYDGDIEKMDIIFDNPDKAKQLRELNDNAEFDGAADDLLSDIDNIDLYEKDPRLVEFSKQNPEFFKLLLDVCHELQLLPEEIEFGLIQELSVLGLNYDELSNILTDLNLGPGTDSPIDEPPTNDGLDGQYNSLSLLESHSFSGQLDLDLILSQDQVVASELFQETLDIYDALSGLGNYSTSNQNESTASILGGVNILFNSGDYDLSSIATNSLLVAASENLTLNGNIVINSSDSLNELLFISSDSITLSEGSSLDFSGNSLGIGSFDSLEVINVDLHAEGEIGVRSLDSIVINNSEFATRGIGADLVHLIAASDLSINNLRFSEQVRNITMEAMTINLSNLNFPDGSTVYLNSAYGGIDGMYPNFGSSVVGRVNFIENVRYNSNLINSQASFNTYGANISIGISGK